MEEREIIAMGEREKMGRRNQNVLFRIWNCQRAKLKVKSIEDSTYFNIFMFNAIFKNSSSKHICMYDSSAKFVIRPIKKVCFPFIPDAGIVSEIIYELLSTYSVSIYRTV